MSAAGATPDGTMAPGSQIWHSSTHLRRLFTLQFVHWIGCQLWNHSESSSLTLVSSLNTQDPYSATPKVKTNILPDSVVPSWNPYFQLEDNKCTGIWSDQIIDTLARTRPGATYYDRPDSSAEANCLKDGQLLSAPTFSKSRLQSIKVSSYLSLSGGITIT